MEPTDDELKGLAGTIIVAIVFFFGGLTFGYWGLRAQHASSERDRCAAIAAQHDDSLERYRDCVSGSESWTRYPQK